MSERKTETFSGTRVTVTTSTSYDVILNRLNQEIERDWPASKNSAEITESTTKEDFVRYFQENTGPSGFIQFYDIDHGKWLRLFDVRSGLRSKRVLLGNPLIARTMLEHDLRAGLYVPVELLLLESDAGKGAQIIYILPSSLIASVNPENEKLSRAAKALDDKFESLVKKITATQD